jgi:Flp pilus assembly protein TadB
VTSRPAWRRSRAIAALTLLSSLALPASAAAAGSSPTPQVAARHARVVMMLLDNHRSWAGRGIPPQRTKAALQYADNLPGNVWLGLIVFNTGWRLVLPPTPDRSLFIQKLSTVPSAGGNSTGIYNAITDAESVLKRLGAASSSLVILSNAEEVISRPPFIPTVPTYVFPWRYDGDDNIAELNSLASYSRGHVAQPSAAPSLAKGFPSTVSPAPAAPPSPAPAAHGLKVSGLLIGALCCVFLALFLIALRVLRPLTGRDPRRLVGQVDRYGPRHAPAEPEAEGTVTRTATGWASRLLRSTNTERGLSDRLDWAGISRSPAEWLLLTVCGCVVLAGALTVLTRSLLLSIPVGALVGWLAQRLYVSVRIGRRRGAFSEQLPDVLQLIAGSLQSGFSLPQALDAVVREDTQPAAGEFSRALAEARIGANLEDAIQRVADRMDSTDLRWTVMAIRIQREVGGNLAEVLLTTVGTMRERAFLRRQVRALSAEGRLSAYILIALPIVVGGWFFYSDPKYMRLLYTTVPGLIMFVGSAVLIVVGALWMRKLIDIEV